jgi:hypothetical protein
MVSCEDCIHNDVCDYRGPERYATIQDMKNDCAYCIPTADVVPKSEFSIVGVQNMALENTNVDLQRCLVIAETVASAAVGKASEMIAEAKREVAREIFEDLEMYVEEHNGCSVNLSRCEFAELKKKYTEDQT